VSCMPRYAWYGVIVWAGNAISPITQKTKKN
jgi:hypothetical protein